LVDKSEQKCALAKKVIIPTAGADAASLAADGCRRVKPEGAGDVERISVDDEAEAELALARRVELALPKYGT